MMSSLKALGEALRFCNTSADLNSLHPIVRFLISSRICVVFMTVYAVAIGGLAAALNGVFDPLIFTVVMLLFILLHMADNLLNDLSDYRKEIDVEGYPRLQYAPHPVIQGIIPLNVIKGYVATTLLISMAFAIYLGITKTPLVPILALVGALVMLGYSGIPIDLKKLGLGEIGVFIVWGVVMAGGTYTALSGLPPIKEALLYTPYGLTVSLVLIGKHLDKYEMDREKGVKTLPVRLGYNASLALARLISISAPFLAAAGIYLYTGSEYAVVALLSLPMSYVAYRAFSLGKPREKPGEWRIWPLWFAAWSYLSLDSVGRYTVLALLAVAAGDAWGPWIAILAALSAFSDIRKSRDYTTKFLSWGSE